MTNHPEKRKLVRYMSAISEQGLPDTGQAVPAYMDANERNDGIFARIILANLTY
jgi:hypothetical protein